MIGPRRILEAHSEDQVFVCRQHQEAENEICMMWNAKRESGKLFSQ